ncbi:MAG: bifunctional serine/threonine-protein kinase/formylglycine-generating enzyme family protein [Oscillatoria sp. PMC 1068.18]|nr:bifunctional serine/threonine-protein kinase/formylglycine-generating enzyme family protein [Oscillatoria sp. PMC 1076.18]MEC4989453.1 bifunctional serine/threonine-protein kinase/formylglycine-generating enzyme family protein [Oscillatoria sp. PMC 1068.18]
MSYFQPGQLLKKGKYQIRETLGGGGFGVTYLAAEQPKNKLVAIKTLNLVRHGNSPNFDELQEKFINEAITLAACSHPHIVRVYPQLFQEDRLWCMVMEYIPGQNLAEYIQDNGTFSEAEALRIIFQVGDALKLIHQRRFLHRDLKPGNILLRESDKTAVLIDFGLAREYEFGQINSMTDHTTERYAPPEQYERRGIFAPSLDVYSLAATLYVLLTANLLPPGDFRKKYNIPIDTPRKLNSAISQQVSEAIIWGLELDPEKRPQSVEIWLNALQNQPKLPTFSFEVVTVNNRGKIIKREQKQAEYLTIWLPGDIPLEMVSIPGGTFLMGAPENEKNSYDFERPQHRVTIQPFFMGKYPVTQAQWQAVASLPQIERSLEPDPSDFKGKNRPVEEVSWYDCVEFTKRISKKYNLDCRLPSEAEWEYACRAGTTTPFHYGATLTSDLANYNASYTYDLEPKSKYRSETTNVGIFPANAFGLYDLHGNVWEWCADDWHESYEGAPSDGSAWLRKANNDNHSQKLLRGGSWDNNPRNCRSAYRVGNSADNRTDINGFRAVVCGA